jgi:uncharacterized cupin superfamily protein
MPKLDLQQFEPKTGCRYPAPYDEPCTARQWLPLGAAGGLTNFGVNLVTLKPGVWSSQRHWHALEDEFVYILSGELILVDDAGRHVMRPGDAAAFKAGEENGHHLINESTQEATFLVVGGHNDSDHGAYSDIDMVFLAGRYAGSGGYRRKDGSSF